MAGHDHIIHISEEKIEATQDAVHLALESVPSMCKPNVMHRNSKRPNGVVIAVFGMSSLFIKIWC
jgi:hypothetical protein